MSKEYKIRFDVYGPDESDTCTYEVMETLNLSMFRPGKRWHIGADSNIKDWIIDELREYEESIHATPLQRIHENELQIQLVQAYDSKTVELKGKSYNGAIEIQTPQHSSFEIRHDHAGAFSNLYDISTSLDNVAESISEQKEPNGRSE